MRLLRDLRFFEAARTVLGRLQTVLQNMESRDFYATRLETLALGVELADISQQTDGGATQLANITERVEKHCSELLASKEEVSPALSLLLHCIHLATYRGFPASESAVSTVQKMLPEASASLAELLEAFFHPAADGHQLLALVQIIEAARNHEDIAFDLKQVAVAARRFLDTQVSEDNAHAVILAIEVLAEHAIRGSFTGRGDSGFTSLGITWERAAKLSTLGYRILALGLGEKGRLVRVSIVDGKLEELVVEEEGLSSAQALKEWSRRFPYDYSRLEDPNEFWTSTEGLRLGISTLLPTIVVMDTQLQQLPPNLIRLGQDFAGRMVPVASAPSISWLAASCNSPTPAKSRRSAWIPTGTGQQEDIALVWLAERLQECLDEHGFLLDRDTAIPNGLGDSELAVVVAHGALLPEERFIQRISGSEHLAMYPETLASAVAGSSVVILFICSGGRVDSHPQAQTTVGLVKQLLDRGCTSVVASPWPLDVKIPPRWLPSFLRRWSEGDAVIDAVYRANADVAAAFGGDPVDCLAMNLFGNPLWKRSQ